MPQFRVDPKTIRDHRALLTGSEAKHLVRVLRYKAGDTLRVTDGEKRYKALIESADSRAVVLNLVETLPARAPENTPALAVALLKQDRLEGVVQKGVELGCSRFLVFPAARSIPRYTAEQRRKKIGRLEAIGLEAAKQCGLPAPPQVEMLESWDGLLRRGKEFSDRLLAYEGEPLLSFHAAFEGADSRSLLLIVGPEGGFTDGEIGQAQAAGFRLLSLGNLILRSETAALLLLGLAQYELGNL